MSRLAALALLCGLLLLNDGRGQEPKGNPWGKSAPAPKLQRAVYAVKNADPAVLAQVIGQHFKGEASAFAAPPGSGNAVLVSGTAETVPEVVKLLELLDRKPRTVEIEVTIAEVPAKDWKEAEPKPEELAKWGQQIKLTAIEGQPVSTQMGASKPIVTSTAVAPGGFGGPAGAGGPGGAAGGRGGFQQRSISYRDVGTTVKAAARVGADDIVAVELSVEGTRVRTADAADEPAAPSVETGSLTTKVSVPAGKSVVAQAVRTEGKGGATISVVVVTARPTAK
ncbi:hypothetical protein R5W23_003005 [Gemmata sp. JC673]|uniref:NolW-like domain-containing protein n=1 Tax=Gemmata algarum TaxID=2975278 RepID=A0ABU5ER84_9BACT|nr:secretin N-terminal domain-containing protein [Gemmata algarum]MDY3557740.1 hypothetical protein [Gemmata algarum]